MDDGYTLHYVGTRNAATGRAEALLVRCFPDGRRETLEGRPVALDAPRFETPEASLAEARQRFVCRD